MSGADPSSKRSRRISGEPVLEEDFHFPLLSKFHPPDKLPTVASVVGRLRMLCHRGKNNMMTRQQAVAEVSKEIESKYYHDTVHCKSLPAIRRSVTTLYDDFTDGKKEAKKGRLTLTKAKAYVEMIKNKDTLFDMSTDDPERRKLLDTEWGVTMGQMEKAYLEDQRGPRLMSCDHGVDPVFYRYQEIIILLKWVLNPNVLRAWMRSQRQKEREVDYMARREEQFRGKNIDQISDWMKEQGEIPSDSPVSSVVTPAKEASEGIETPRIEAGQGDVGGQGKKRRLFTAPEERVGDSMPQEYRHIRESERIVSDKYYETCADLAAAGLSLDECTSAVVIVGRGMFGRPWKKSEDSKESFDLDTAPQRQNLLEKLRQIEAQRVNLMVDVMVKGKEEGRMITLASDSTTKARVGQFIGQGIHVGQNDALPLPLLPIHGEKKEDIAAQLGMGLEILSACSGVPAEELAGQLDTLLTDSTEHNKGVNVKLQQLYQLDTLPGQIFCGTHTTLGFSNTMNSVVTKIELKMGLDKVLNTFMCSMDLDSKNGSLAGQACDMMLKLFAPEFQHKSWNYYGSFVNYMEERGEKKTLFAYKDQRFGCLSRACAVLLHNYPHIEGFLSINPQISNKLACLVRELLNLPHLKVIFVVFSILGVHLIEPFYSRTIRTGATHTELGKFYRELHSSLLTANVEVDIISLASPLFAGVSEELFEAVKSSYGQDVVESVREAAEEHSEDVALLVKHMLPELATTLARQRRDYGLDEEAFPAQFPVEKQASEIDDTPTNNMAMERLMGLTDQRLKKLQTLPATSRSIILMKTKAFKEAREMPNFRSFKQQVEAKRNLEAQWNQKMSEKLKEDEEKRQEVALGKERKRLQMLEELKQENGPFTNAEQVEEFMAKEISENEKQARLKKEVKFARDSSTTLPKVDSLFKIQVPKKFLLNFVFQMCLFIFTIFTLQVTLQNKRRRDKTAAEFAEALMSYLGRKSDRSIMNYESFQQSLKELAG